MILYMLTPILILALGLSILGFIFLDEKTEWQLNLLVVIKIE